MRSTELFLEFLEKNNSNCEDLRIKIYKAQLAAEENLTLGAEAIIALEDSEFQDLMPGDEFRKEKDERLSHLFSISRIILGH